HRTEDIQDRVQRANLVEVDRIDARAVDFGLGLRQPSKDGGHRALHGGRHGHPVHDLQDVTQVPMSVLVGQLEANPAARDAAPVGTLDDDIDAAEPECRDEGSQPLRIESDIDQGAQDHVSADPGERIEDKPSQGASTPAFRLPGEYRSGRRERQTPRSGSITPSRSRSTSARPSTYATAVSGGPCSRPVRAARIGAYSA